MLYHVMLNQNKRFKRFKVPSCTFKVNLKGPPHSPTCNFYDNITILLIRYDRLIYNSFVSCNSHVFLGGGGSIFGNFTVNVNFLNN